MMNVVIALVSVVIFLLLLGWLGLQIRPKPFASFPQRTSVPKTVALPAGLPTPVERFYRQINGANVPLIESVVITGRASLRVKGITFPGRFRFTHNAGKGYRHYIEATLFGLPILKINEHYLDGKSRLQLPFGISEGSKVDQGANLALWAESIWLPSILITDPRVHWEAIDEETALLIVPFGNQEQRFVVRFEPKTGVLFVMESMRYKDPDSDNKTLWLNEVSEWISINGSTIPAVGAVTWFDDGTPWAVFRVEDVAYNVDVQDYIRANGS